jgi:hypothetical protein
MLTAQTPNSRRETYLQTFLTRAFESHVIGEDDVPAVVTDLPPIFENVHLPEPEARNTIGTPRIFPLLFYQTGSLLFSIKRAHSCIRLHPHGNYISSPIAELSHNAQYLELRGRCCAFLETLENELASRRARLALVRLIVRSSQQRFSNRSQHPVMRSHQFMLSRRLGPPRQPHLHLSGRALTGIPNSLIPRIHVFEVFQKPQKTILEALGCRNVAYGLQPNP